MGEAAETSDIEVLIRLAASGSFGSRVVAALLRRIVEMQDATDETALLAIVAQVEALLRSEGEGPH